MPIIILFLMGLLAQSPQSKPTPAAPPVMRVDPQAPQVNLPSQPSSPRKNEPQEVAEDDVISVDTTVVNVPVTVLEHNGKYVPDLRKEDFRLWEDGVEQKLAYYAHLEKPITVALLIDVSDSTVEVLPEIRRAAITFIEQVRPDDRVMVMTFDSRLNILSEPTTDRETLRKAIASVKSGQGTRLYDAVDFVVNHRLKKISGRKALVVFTDGVDTFSRATARGTLHDLEEQEILVYPVQYETELYLREQNGNSDTLPKFSDGGNSRHKAYEQAKLYLNGLASTSGGSLYGANGRQSIAQSFAQVAEALRWQYSLGYYPQPPGEAGTRHKVKVRVNRPKVAVRAKQSYVRLPQQDMKK
jgi:VWFA-related protein